MKGPFPRRYMLSLFPMYRRINFNQMTKNSANRIPVVIPAMKMSPLQIWRDI